MHTPSLFTILIFTLLTHIKNAQACMHYKAVFPHSPTLPYEASISDNSVTTCWISTTYAEHKALQIAVKPQKTEMKYKGKMKRSNGYKGYKAHANVGARTVTYIAHGQEFYFIPNEQEDVENEKWVYDLKLWCGKPGKNGLILP
ncbi:hypothetical protein BDZ45DRAFT_578288 [Acephala macrosclerotiorum]|nr:hypothetical protein BDZ45DRAFT_578288 [Acephala macrosclerotiorum]